MAMRAHVRFDHPLAYEHKEEQVKAGTKILSMFLPKCQVKVYDVEINRLFFVEFCSTKTGKKWIAQTAHFKHDINSVEIEFTSFGWEP